MRLFKGNYNSGDELYTFRTGIKGLENKYKTRKWYRLLIWDTRTKSIRLGLTIFKH